MAHPRTEVRNAFKTALTGIPGIVKITGPRPFHFEAAEMPALVVSTPSEISNRLDQDPEDIERVIDVEVSIVTLGNDGADDALDVFAEQVEQAILTASGGVWDSLPVHQRHPEGTQLEIGQAAEKTLFALRIQFSVELTA